MKSYFKNLLVRTKTPEVTVSQINDYKTALIKELIKMGATESEKNLVCNEMIINSIINNRRVEDVAWAILQ